jgi:hypothetical protein
VEQGWAVFLAAVVTASASVLVALLTKVKKENKQDHQYVSAMLTLVYKAVNRTDSKVDKIASEVDSLRDEVRTHKH